MCAVQRRSDHNCILHVRQYLFGELDVHFPCASGVARLGEVIVAEKASS